MKKSLTIEDVIIEAKVFCIAQSVTPNKELFGVYILSTQSGFELLQGHSPVAQGSWMHHWEDMGNPLYEYAHKNIKNLDSLNEYEASQARKHLAMDWAVHHPLKEIILTARKIVIYFFPDNFEELSQKWCLNIFTLLTHLLFLAGILRRIQHTAARNHASKAACACVQ